MSACVHACLASKTCEFLTQGGTPKLGAEPEVLSLWIPLANCNAHTGCLQLVKGSHRRGLVPMSRGPGRKARPHAAEGVIESNLEPMAVGDVLAFHSLTLHGTYAGNGRPPLPDYVRWSVDLRFSDAAGGLQWAAHGYASKFPSVHVGLEHGRRRADAKHTDSWTKWAEAWSHVHARSERPARL
jgi:hypothetical protein